MTLFKKKENSKPLSRGDLQSDYIKHTFSLLRAPPAVPAAGFLSFFFFLLFPQ